MPDYSDETGDYELGEELCPSCFKTREKHYDEQHAWGTYPKYRMESAVVSMRVSREELHTLTEAARFHGVSLSAYIRQEALRAARQPQVKLTFRPADPNYLVTITGS
jgi:hypothetical protein